MWVYQIILLTALCVIKQASCAPPVSELNEPWMEEEIESWAIKGNQSERFNAILDSLVCQEGLQNENLRGERGISMCALCRVTVKVFISLRHRGVSADSLRNRAIDLCVLLKLYSPNVCRGIITLNAPIFDHIVMNKPNLQPKSVCGLMLESETCPLDNEEFEWEVSIDQNPSSPIEIESSNENIKIVQITDLHYDPNYEPYGNSLCGEPMCCRKGQNATNNSGKVAGYWGDYNWCDMPWHSVIDALDHVNNTHKNVSYVYYTGDIVDHGVWDTTKEGNIKSLNKSFHQIKKTFQDIPVYPILGNHEAQPMNVFAPTHVEEDVLSTKWLFSKIADLWISFGWLPESTRPTILHGGFYTLSPKPGFRIIALNSNVCYRFNWWLLYNPQDPYGQLQWLADTLRQAENNREFVHILSHVPPGDRDCIYTWSREFRRIVKRFSHIISGQFNGHTHNDEIEVFFDPENNNAAYNIAWNAGSLTPFANLNPNYKVYTVNAQNYMVKDYENWMYNLTLANEFGPEKPPQWYKSYSFKEEYNLKDTSYESIKDWVSLLSKNESMLRTYYRHFMTDADPAFAAPCGKTCLDKYACQIVVTENTRPSDCGV